MDRLPAESISWVATDYVTDSCLYVWFTTTSGGLDVTRDVMLRVELTANEDEWIPRRQQYTPCPPASSYLPIQSPPD